MFEYSISDLIDEYATKCVKAKDTMSAMRVYFNLVGITSKPVRPMHQGADSNWLGRFSGKNLQTKRGFTFNRDGYLYDAYTNTEIQIPDA